MSTEINEKVYNEVFSEVVNDLMTAVDVTGGIVKLERIFEEIDSAFIRRGYDVDRIMDTADKMASEVVSLLTEEGCTVL